MSLLLLHHIGYTSQGAAFQRAMVDYMIAGTARVTWTFKRHFVDPNPETWVYQLQASESGMLTTHYPGSGQARLDDWVDVGDPVVDPAFLLDTTRRAFGKLLLVTYRIKLITPLGQYFSDPTTTYGLLNKQDWLRAKEIFRKEDLLHKKATSVSGYIFRRKRHGTPCPKCSDPSTQDIKISKCDFCKGTRYVHGYYPAFPYSYCRLENSQGKEQRDISSVGSKMDSSVKGRIISIPGLNSFDVWVDGYSDLRYYIHVVGEAAKIRNVPLIYDIELRQADFNDVVYSLSLEGA